MILGAEIGMIFGGLYILWTGKYQLSKTRIVRGGAARFAALFLLLPLPLAFGIGFWLGITGNTALLTRNNLSLAGVEVVLIIACLAISLVIAYSSPYDSY